ncbi:MAG TPA: CsbD family protein [Bdellovibrionales bacterium]|jgi:uncharacterized protein YjbJ (UPF0337 family)|nr:CsbD family protein [Bdellovibrionales bacterium]
MNWDQIQGKWKEMRGQARSRWAEMTDSDFEKIGGKKDELVGWLQQKYGYAKDRADRELEEFGRDVDSNRRDSDVNRREDV